MYFITEVKYQACIRVNGVHHDSPVMGATSPVHPPWIDEKSKIFNLKSHAESFLEEFKKEHKIDEIDRINNDVYSRIVEVESKTTPINELDRVRLTELIEILTIEKEKRTREIEIDRVVRI